MDPVATGGPGEAQELAEEGAAARSHGCELAAVLLALDRPVLRPLAEPVDLGPVHSTPTHWDVPRASRWRCHCPECSATGVVGRRAFSWAAASAGDTKR